ncbi:sensor histidine kinase [Aridibaculum aurantiacum]|uniref:sensor histidine kinase n=1 Tax=Aridibaculum aurantiacum TaxID=2810307 RepID=UPI001A963146|nr:histidine kinase [Aridibaculum aurantiacum]
MTDINKRRENIIRFEFWAITTLYVFFLFFWIMENATGNEEYYTKYKDLFSKAGLPFNYHLQLFLPTLVDYLSWYAAFWVINFFLVPKIVAKDKTLKHLFFVGLLFLGVAAIDFGSDCLRLAYLYPQSKDSAATTLTILENVAMETFQFVVLVVIYTMLKYTALYFITQRKATEGKYRSIQRNGTDALVLWLMSMFILAIAEAGHGFLVGWGLVAPLGILLYMYSSYTLIPAALKKRRPSVYYMVRVVLLMIILFFPLFLFAVLTTRSEDLATSIASLNVTIQILITAPLSWVLYKRQQKGREEIHVLEKELTQSTASLDFLRSQINPHFLFNALNNIYGMAIMENAERTSEAVQKLSDMMRFMLQENMQERIPLSSEINYLNNYIGLQNLRTDANPRVQVETQIQETEAVYHVAPMLLIPFVENAFKHGISFREASRISISLEVKNDTLYFDVYNTIHPKSANDPEKFKSGIGLENVRQRLQLLYPNKHELTIRETSKEYFVHLILQLA